ncbi:MAG: riboflavin synthase [Candidatus Omnitrophica bacterium]|nr:riboflavin synthase [Candidatus Omnitrophota bacterium]
MFTGIIEELGSVDKILKKDSFFKLEIKAEKIITTLKVGDSVSVNGVCLTIVETKKDKLIFDCIGETLKRTNLGMLKVKEKVNLERALKLDSFLSGHIVLGHVDGMGKILKKIKEESGISLFVDTNKEILDYLVPKGSISLDGVSLTIVEIENSYFSVNIIPHTAENTTLGFKNIGDYLNIEIDIFAKYVNKILTKKKGEHLSEGFLREHGFL